MNHDERSYIDALFGRLAEVERDGPARDAEAEAHIADHVGRRPSAPYYMAQTILVQERALEAAQGRIAELEAQAERGGGLFGALFGGGRTGGGQGAGHGHAHGVPPRRAADPGMGRARPEPAQARGAGPGFMGGAMQTALGVAGGVVIGSMIANALTPDATAAETGDAGGGDPGADGGWDDGGGGDFDFGDGF